MKKARSSPQTPIPEIIAERSGDAAQILFKGPFTIHRKIPALPNLETTLEGSSQTVRLDGSGVTEWDSSLLVSLKRICALLGEKGREAELSGFPDSITPLLERAKSSRKDLQDTQDVQPGDNLLIRLGERGINAYRGFKRLLLFLGETALSLGRFFRGKAIFQRSDFLNLLWDNTGRSIGIVFLISFLTGLILAFVGAIQLSKFGADIFVADLVSIAMFREMGAMMTGVILAGRTGSAFAAQIGSMKANDELNALQTMGISSFDFIVMPRLVSLSLMMPVLAFLAALSGILGGMVVSVGFMDITATQFLAKTAGSLTLNSFLSGTGKSVVFGAIIAMTGCFRGMSAGSSAEAVGKAATSAVVTSIVLIIVADALFAVLFNIYGI